MPFSARFPEWDLQLPAAPRPRCHCPRGVTVKLELAVGHTELIEYVCGIGVLVGLAYGSGHVGGLDAAVFCKRAGGSVKGHQVAVRSTGRAGHCYD